MRLNEHFDQHEFADWIESFLPDFSLDIRKVEVPNSFSEVLSIQTLGESNLGVRVYIIKTNTDPSRRKVGLANESFSLLKSYATSTALIAYYSDSTSQWRLSLLTSTPTWNKDKIITKLSNPKRFSYLLGANTKLHTPTDFLIKKGKVADIEDLKSRFSLDVVNKEFYKNIALAFTKLIGGIRNSGKKSITYPCLLKLADKKPSSLPMQEFAVRLIGRIIFGWFLKEIKSSTGTPLIPSSLLSIQAIPEKDRYYHTVLAPLFFEVLNHPLDERRDDHFYEDPYNKIPYLNGGLFQDQPDDYYKYNTTSHSAEYGLVDIPNEWFKEFFEILEQYNFTVDENTSVDIDLSIDPEMLGRIFENLLAEVNPDTGESARKSTGSFYTPRVIVEYMVDESIILYLKQKTNIEEEKLRALISYDLNDDTENPLIDEEKQKVVNALYTVTILDPACGSGAFPIGALQKIVYILEQIDPRAEAWFEKQIQQVSPEFRRHLKQELADENFNYIRKMGVIRQSIFGIDIQPIAVEIARLRCFLTLIVEQKVEDDRPNRGIRPLPNLDFKFVAANSLIGLPKLNDDSKNQQQTMFDNESNINTLKEIRNEYFGATGLERIKVEKEFSEQQHRMMDELISSHGWIAITKADITTKLKNWKPFSHQSSDWFEPDWMFGVNSGFDIVIGNPPYVRQEKIFYKAELNKHYPSIMDGRADLYTYFIKQGFNLLRNNGVISFITSNKYLVRGYGKKIRKFLSEKVTIRKLINFGELPVFQASVDSAIIIGTNTSPNQNDAISFVQAKSQDHIADIYNFFSNNHSEQKISALGENSWVLGESEKIALLNKLIGNKTTLGKHLEIFGGIKTGFDDAFVLDESLKQQLIKDDSKSLELIKPWLKGRDIKKWATKHHQYIIYIPQNKINIDEYVSIKNHLLKHKNRLLQRATKQKWYELQQPQERFTSLFEKPKIVYCEIAKEMRAFKDISHSYGTMKMFFIPYDPVILAILNSKLFDWYARMTFSSLGDPWNGGRLEFKTMYMSKLPLPELGGSIQTEISKIVELLSDNETNPDYENKINNLVYKLYDLTPEEIEMLEQKAR